MVDTEKHLVHKMVDIEVGELSCYVREGAGPSLVLLPGTWHDHSEFYPVLEKLGPTQNVLLLDLRGRGKSWPAQPNESIEDHAEEVVRALRNMGVTEYYIGGRSLGGMIAIEVGRIDSEHVRGIIPMEGWTHWSTKKPAFDDLVGNMIGPEDAQLEQEHGDRVKAPYTEEEIQAFSSVWKEWNGYEFLMVTDIRILEIWGDRGQRPPSRDKLRIPDKENIEVVFIENADHHLTIEAPERLAQLISSFIANVEGQTARDL